RLGDVLESEGATGGAAVAVQRGGCGAPGEVQVRQAVVVAVEGRDTSAHEIAVIAGERVADACRFRFLDETGRRQRGATSADGPGRGEPPEASDRKDCHDEDRDSDARAASRRRGERWPPPRQLPSSAGSTATFSHR